MNRKYTPSKINAEEFIRIWQTSATLDEICEKTSMDKVGASRRAVAYRKRGIPLKKFEGKSVLQKKLDIEALTALALSLAEKPNG